MTVYSALHYTIIYHTQNRQIHSSELVSEQRCGFSRQHDETDMKSVNREESTTTPFETLHQRTSHAQDAAKVEPVIRREHRKSVVGDRMDISYYKSGIAILVLHFFERSSAAV